MNQKIPGWLKAMQNGALGEARAKAFLMDRFWILERSVDIDGADFIIQRRITNKNLLDENPPRLGFIQVKFFESENTTQYIPKAYIMDDSGNLRDEFFLLCHTGFEESSQIYFLTSEMVSSDFELTIKSNIEKYKIYGSRLLKNRKYLVDSKSLTLDRIEQKLVFADFKRNREFISWKLPKSEVSAILPEYCEPLDNSWGHIPVEFQKIKESAIKSMEELETLYLDLNAIAEESDPIEAFNIIEKLNYELNSAYYGSWGQKIMENLYDENFYYVCKGHKEKVEVLRGDGLLDKFIKSKEIIKASIVDFLCKNLPIDANTVHSIIINFSLDDFKFQSLKHYLASANEYFDVPASIDRFGHIKGKRSINPILASQADYEILAGPASWD